MADFAKWNPTAAADTSLTHPPTQAVHSLKDMPTTLPSGLVLAAIGEREAPEDVLLVHPKHKGCGGLAGLPEGSVVGTSSIRRAAVVHQAHPSLTVEVIRGNLNTRLAKLDGLFDWSTSKSKEISYDAVILARAGVIRLGWEDRIEAVLSATEMPYGVSQGSLGLECRADDELAIRLCRAVNHVPSLARCLAERSLLRGLQGGCQIALGVHSSFRATEKGDEEDGKEEEAKGGKAGAVEKAAKASVGSETIADGATPARARESTAAWTQQGHLTLSATLMRDGSAPSNAARKLGHLTLRAEASRVVRCAEDAECVGAEVARALLAQGGDKLVDPVPARTEAAGATATTTVQKNASSGARALSYGSAESPNKDAAAAIGSSGRSADS